MEELLGGLALWVVVLMIAVPIVLIIMYGFLCMNVGHIRSALDQILQLLLKEEKEEEEVEEKVEEEVEEETVEGEKEEEEKAEED